jgi:hypothetical protein
MWWELNFNIHEPNRSWANKLTDWHQRLLHTYSSIYPKINAYLVFRGKLLLNLTTSIEIIIDICIFLICLLKYFIINLMIFITYHNKYWYIFKIYMIELIKLASQNIKCAHVYVLEEGTRLSVLRIPQGPCMNLHLALWCALVHRCSLVVKETDLLAPGHPIWDASVGRCSHVRS